MKRLVLGIFLLSSLVFAKDNRYVVIAKTYLDGTKSGSLVYHTPNGEVLYDENHNGIRQALTDGLELKSVVKIYENDTQKLLWVFIGKMQ